MRYRRYIRTQQPDGSVVVVSHGPFMEFYRLLSRPFLLIFLVCFLWQFFVGHFATAGAFLLLYAIFVPKRQKARTIKGHA